MLCLQGCGEYACFVSAHSSLVYQMLWWMRLLCSMMGLFWVLIPSLLAAYQLFSVDLVSRQEEDGMADMILVNSNFTASTFANTFKRLHARGSHPAVLYPAVNTDQFNKPQAYK
ncbi:unnamed protein product [Eruca vesicaria subsp. sativa]|uniref:Uncharacterized protein n=1 Tax=Eruca vesicaria subsp. sativa TaxID=29727 RepID=A0ABC8JAZ0_ERUVS|nr:unnamed protein product [Eruca vesicaria subsp. sativa]